jgi:hypothetical protein
MELAASLILDGTVKPAVAKPSKAAGKLAGASMSTADKPNAETKL